MVLPALTLHARCVGQSLEVAHLKLAQTWLHRMETGLIMAPSTLNDKYLLNTSLSDLQFLPHGVRIQKLQ